MLSSLSLPHTDRFYFISTFSYTGVIFPFFSPLLYPKICVIGVICGLLSSLRLFAVPFFSPLLQLYPNVRVFPSGTMGHKGKYRRYASLRLICVREAVCVLRGSSLPEDYLLRPALKAADAPHFVDIGRRILLLNKVIIVRTLISQGIRFICIAVFISLYFLAHEAQKKR